MALTINMQDGENPAAPCTSAAGDLRAHELCCGAAGLLGGMPSLKSSAMACKVTLGTEGKAETGFPISKPRARSLEVMLAGPCSSALPEAGRTHRHTLPPPNSWKQQDLHAEGLHPELTLGDAMGVSQQPRARLSQLPLLPQGAGQCSESQAGLRPQHQLCPALHVPGWHIPSQGPPVGRTPMHSHVCALPTRAMRSPGQKSSRLACVSQPAAARQQLPDQSATCRKPAQVHLSWAGSPDAVACQAPPQRKAQCHLFAVYWTGITPPLGVAAAPERTGDTSETPSAVPSTAPWLCTAWAMGKPVQHIKATVQRLNWPLARSRVPPVLSLCPSGW